MSVIDLVSLPLALESHIKAKKDDSSSNTRKRRGTAINWYYVARYPNIAAALECYSDAKLNERSLSKGRTTRAKTTTRYYNCRKMSCGCKVMYRIRSLENSPEIIEEETSFEHTDHERFVRYGGRGITDSQKTIVEEAISQDCQKPIAIKNYFATVFKRELLKDPTFELVPVPDIKQLTNYLAYRKVRNSNPDAHPEGNRDENTGNNTDTEHIDNTDNTTDNNDNMSAMDIGTPTEV